MTITERQIDDELSLDRAKKWQCLWFRNNGETDLYARIFSTRADAQKSAEKCMKSLSEKPRYMQVDWRGSFIPCHEVSHIIPIPVEIS